ncbi:hypothetical protein J1N35_028786 [Gossypium stocksii]|uniref:Uncharacterized protein n=1 Tax=Gossypium stocksii TaxID=47602 RepID=A0A9D3UYK9_9ROSI|nr:hypothetical protein J1N35_028786 [Gossypium stocksii]
MEWMIKWMQEMSPMGTDYARRHSLQKTKYEEGEEENEDEDVSDEEEKRKELAHDYDLDDMFQSKQPIVRMVKLHSPS